MGFNTTVFILNDMLTNIERDPEGFVRGIVENMNDGGTFWPGQTTVMPSQHADTPRLYFSYANSMVELSAWNKETKALMESGDFRVDVIRQYTRMARAILERFEEELDEPGAS